MSKFDGGGKTEFTEDEERKLREAAEILDRASKRAVAKIFRALADIVER